VGSAEKRGSGGKPKGLLDVTPRKRIGERGRQGGSETSKERAVNRRGNPNRRRGPWAKEKKETTDTHNNPVGFIY